MTRQELHLRLEKAEALLRRLREAMAKIRLAMPRYYHMSGYPEQHTRVELWGGDDIYRATLHLHWNWFGKAHWLLISAPEWPF